MVAGIVPRSAALHKDAGRLLIRRRADKSRLSIATQSPGCGIASAAAAAAAGDPALDVRGAVMLTPWDRLPAVAQTHYWYLPARWLARDKYDKFRNLRAFPGPVAVQMADPDQVIPNKHTTRLYDALSEPKRLWVFENAGHNTWPTSPREARWAEGMGWLESAASDPGD